MKEIHIINIYSENTPGLLARIAGIFTRRHINIEAITVSKSELEGISRFTIVVNEPEELVKKVTLQCEKQIDVYKAFWHHENNVVYQKLALYKLDAQLANDNEFKNLIASSNARILTVEEEFLIVEKVDTDKEIVALFETLKAYGILEFNKSGRIAITKPMKTLETHLQELEASI